jgi:hypothetical protein
MQELLPRSKAETHRTPAIMMGFHSVTTHPTVFCRVQQSVQIIYHWAAGCSSTLSSGACSVFSSGSVMTSSVTVSEMTSGSTSMV